MSEPADTRHPHIDPLFVPPRVAESTFANDLAELHLPESDCEHIEQIHRQHVAAEAYQMAAVAIGQIMRAAAGVNPVCAVLARQLHIMDETLPDIGARFGKSKQAMHEWHLVLQQEFCLRGAHEPPPKQPHPDAVPWSLAPRYCGLSRRRLLELRSAGRLKTMPGQDGVSLWVRKTELRQVEHRELVAQASSRRKSA